ncbi:MAG TPA: penicillin-binding protein, partial [Sphingomonadaceae bacterium]|nr:penicillin-binding protein [Sphingomonadaceae bacterium]
AGVHGGGLPARIWKDFMSQALGPKVVPAKRKATPQPDPSGPVQPLDVPEGAEIPIGTDGTNLRVKQGEAVLSTQVNGMPVDVRLTNDGLTVAPGTSAPRSSPSPGPSP